MLADPQEVTINAVAVPLPRIQMKDLSSVYESADGLVKFAVGHTITKDARQRTLVRLDKLKVVTDPLDSSNDFDQTSVHIVIDRPNFGFTVADVQHVVAALKAWLTDANVEKLYGRQS